MTIRFHLVAAASALAMLGLSASSANAFDGAFVPIEGGVWDIEEGPIEYVLEPNGSADISDGSDLQALRDAFRAWSCVAGTSIRFVELDEPGPATIDLQDGKNTLFWDETGEFGLGPGTLGVTVGETAGTRTAADIVFNGADSEWSTDDGPTRVDVGSIAIHEIGHFIGLDHPCDPGETNCNGSDRSIMTPAWDNTVGREPLPDDQEGVVALYPAADSESRCDGPFQKGEKCGCDDECADGLLCVTVPGRDSVCGEPCAADQADCGNGFVCALSAPAGDEPAPGVCVKSEGGKPAGSICVRGSECASGTCTLLFDLERSLCQVPCEATSDCGGNGTCFQGFCLGEAGNEECPLPPEPECACSVSASSTSATPAAGLALAGALAALVGPRRRREHRARRTG